MRYRRRDADIEAIRFEMCNWDAVCDFLGSAFFESGGRGDMIGDKPVVVIPVKGLESTGGQIVAHHGDWIIRSANGRLWAATPETFERTYEAVDEQQGGGSGAEAKADADGG